MVLKNTPATYMHTHKLFIGQIMDMQVLKYQ